MISLTAGDRGSFNIHNPVSFSLDGISLDPTLQVARMLLNSALLDLTILNFAVVSAKLSLVQRAICGTIYAMRSVRTAEKDFECLLARTDDPRNPPFGKQLYEHGVMLERVACSRIENDTAHLTVFYTAHMIDSKDAKFALNEIAEAKVQVPAVALEVIDRAIQAFGGAGVSQGTPLANM
jgi:alkylation response protein AidB-like acyl-CoA dehydrogenase